MVLIIALVLAVQNMDAHGTVPMGQEIEFSALEGSLNMMSKGVYFSLIFLCELKTRSTQ